LILLRVVTVHVWCVWVVRRLPRFTLLPYTTLFRSDDEERRLLVKQSKDIIELRPGKRHRLVGLEDWAVIAQLWNHVDVQYPSDEDRKSTRLNSSHVKISYAVFCLTKKN